MANEATRLRGLIFSPGHAHERHLCFANDLKSSNRNSSYPKTARRLGLWNGVLTRVRGWIDRVAEWDDLVRPKDAGAPTPQTRRDWKLVRHSRDEGIPVTGLRSPYRPTRTPGSSPGPWKSLVKGASLARFASRVLLFATDARLRAVGLWASSSFHGMPHDGPWQYCDKPRVTDCCGVAQGPTAASLVCTAPHFHARELACFVAVLGLARIWALVSPPIDFLGRRQPWDVECCGHLDAMRWHSTSVGHAVFVSRHDVCAMFMWQV